MPLFQFSNRLEAEWNEPTSDTSLDDWFDARAEEDRWGVHVRLRSQHATAATRDSVGIEQRSLTLRTDPVTITAGNFYQTLGRGFLLRAYENRFVNLGRSDRSFSLDRDIDGVRVESELGNFEFTALSGRPRLTVTSGGSATPETGARVDLLQGLNAKGYLPGDYAWVGVSVLGLERRSLVRGDDPVPEQTMRGVRGGANTDAASLYLEWADIRWATELVGIKDSRALYGEVTASHGDFGVSLEFKNYNNFSSLYSEPPTLVRTHSSVLLNAATHVLKPTEEGVQVELLHTPNARYTTTANFTGAWSEFFGNTFRFRELFAEHRFDGKAIDASVFADWAEDEFSGDRNGGPPVSLRRFMLTSTAYLSMGSGNESTLKEPKPISVTVSCKPAIPGRAFLVQPYDFSGRQGPQYSGIALSG